MSEDSIGQSWRERVGVGSYVGNPAVLSLTAFVLAVLSLAGFGLLNGSAYLLPGASGLPSGATVVAAGLLGAGFALIPVVLGSVAYRRSHPGDPSWVPVVAQSAVLLGALSVVLRLVVTAVSALDLDAGAFARF